VSSELLAQNGNSEALEGDSIDKSVVKDLVIQTNQLQDRVDSLEEELDDKGAKIDDLETTVGELEALVTALKSRNKRLTSLTFGDEWGTLNEDGFRPLYGRVMTLEDDLNEHKEATKLASSSGSSKPDDRARQLRRKLFNKAKHIAAQNDEVNGMEVSFTRDQAEAALEGGLHRGTVLDAMKRAADGQDASNCDAVDYTPINGASDLEASDAITYITGRNDPGRTSGQQSELVMAVDDVTGSEARQNLTTGSTDGGV